MSGTDFRNEYKNAMEELTPSSELLNRISLNAEQAPAEPILLPPKQKNFFSRHRAILSAAATIAVVAGICAVGTVVVSHFNEMNSLTGSASFDKVGAASSFDDYAAENYGEYAEPIDDKDGDIMDADSYSSAVPGAILEGEENAEHSDDKNSISMSDNSVVPDGYSPEAAGAVPEGEEPELFTDEEYYTDSQLRLLAEKAQNGTLTPEDLKKNITVVSNDAYCQAFGNFQRGVVEYTLVGDFKRIEGEFKVMNLYIIETDENGNNRNIDLINHLNFLDRYFAGDYSDN